MFIHYRTRGFVLKEIKRGEADQLFTIYTKDFGKLEILGKATRKISSKLKSGIGLFYLSEVEFIQGKIRKTLTDAVPLKKFIGIKKKLKSCRVVYKISEVLDSLVREREADKEIWQLLLGSFERLDKEKSANWRTEIIYYYFFWNLISILGYRPELYYCIGCRGKITSEKNRFDPQAGGIICQNCFGGRRGGLGMSPEIIKILRIIFKKDWATLLKLKFEARYIKELSSASQNYFSFICENFSSF